MQIWVRRWVELWLRYLISCYLGGWLAMHSVVREPTLVSRYVQLLNDKGSVY